MKLLLIVFFFAKILPAYTQNTFGRLPPHTIPFLVAQNSRHARRYANGDLLKIYYSNGIQIIKAKGGLFIRDSSQLQLIPFGRKQAVIINANDIISVGRWKRSAKIAAAITGGTGIAAISLAAAMEQPYRPGVKDGNIIGLGLVLYSIAILWYEVIAIPSILLTEQLSIRSKKRGYHFFIESRRDEEPVHLRHSLRN